MSAEDQSLAKKAAYGDRDAFEQLVLKYENKVFNIAYRMCGNYEDASELAQEAFIRVFKSINSFRADSEFGTWIYRITVNVCLDYSRKQKKYNNFIINDQNEDDYIMRNLPSKERSPSEYAETKETVREISDALEKLRKDQRAMIVLRDIEGFTYNEISQMLKISEGTVKSRINRARLALSNILSPKLEHLSVRNVKNVRKEG